MLRFFMLRNLCPTKPTKIDLVALFGSLNTFLVLIEIEKFDFEKMSENLVWKHGFLFTVHNCVTNSFGF